MSDLLSAHQAHFSENKNTEIINPQDEVIKSELPGTDNICSINNSLSLECCCCINGICMGSQKDCSSDNMMNNISCKKQCDDSKLNHSTLISENIKTQNYYREHFKINFADTKEVISGSSPIHQKAIQQNTPTYISIQSFLI